MLNNRKYVVFGVENLCALRMAMVLIAHSCVSYDIEITYKQMHTHTPYAIMIEQLTIPFQNVCMPFISNLPIFREKTIYTLNCINTMVTMNVF